MKKIARTLLKAGAVVGLLATLGGCVVVPAPGYYGHGGYYGGYHHHYYRGP
jgi:hypothetical protein